MGSLSRLKLHGSLGSKDHPVYLGVLRLVQLIERVYAMLRYRCYGSPSKLRWILFVLKLDREM